MVLGVWPRRGVVESGLAWMGARAEHCIARDTSEDDAIQM